MQVVGCWFPRQLGVAKKLCGLGSFRRQVGRAEAEQVWSPPSSDYGAVQAGGIGGWTREPVNPLVLL